MVIDVGAPCQDGDGSYGYGWTLVDKYNPANATGTIDSVCVYAAGTTMQHIEFASFDDEGSNVLSTNGDTNGSDLTATSGQSTTFTAAGDDFTAFAINSGEYIGIYFSVGGTLERANSGYTGQWYINSDAIPASSVTFSGFVANRGIAVYGTGSEAVTDLSIDKAEISSVAESIGRMADFNPSIADTPSLSENIDRMMDLNPVAHDCADPIDVGPGGSNKTIKQKLQEVLKNV